MRRRLKILYKLPDSERLAQKYRDFDELMDLHAIQKDQRRKRQRRQGGVLIGVALISSLVTWLVINSPERATQPKAVQQESLEKQEPVDTNEYSQKPSMTVLDSSETHSIENPIVNAKPKSVSPAETDLKQPVNQDTILAKPRMSKKSLVTRDAKPKEGMEVVYDYFAQHLNMPDSLLTDSQIEFEISFQVSASGDLNSIVFEPDFPQAYRAYLKQVVLNMPDWLPALNQGDTVSSTVILPFSIK